jgi:hypothetical protein
MQTNLRQPPFTIPLPQPERLIWWVIWKYFLVQIKIPTYFGWFAVLLQSPNTLTIVTPDSDF